MKHGKIIQFVKDHYVSILSCLVVVVSIGCGVYSCSKSAPVSVNTSRNRVSITIENPFSDGVKKK